MNKTEFLDILYNQLSGRMPEGNVATHVQYYRNYIEDKQQKGHTERGLLKSYLVQKLDGIRGRFKRV